MSAQAIRDQVDACLARLRTDHLDVLYAHVDDQTVAFEETPAAFGELQDHGKVRTDAASNLPAPRLTDVLGVDASAGYRALQQRFTYLLPRADADLSPHALLDEDVSRLCHQHDLARLGYSPLLSGAYTRTDRPFPDGYDPSVTAMAALPEIAADRDAHLLEVLMRLKDTGMSMAKIAEFTRLVAADPHEVPERLALLQEHRSGVVAQLASWSRSNPLDPHTIRDYELDCAQQPPQPRKTREHSTPDIARDGQKAAMTAPFVRDDRRDRQQGPRTRESQ